MSLSKPSFGGLTRGLYNLCDNDSLINPSYDYGVKYIVMSVFSSSFLSMGEKAKLDIDYLEIDPNLLITAENLLNTDWIHISRR